MKDQLDFLTPAIIDALPIFLDSSCPGIFYHIPADQVELIWGNRFDNKHGYFFGDNNFSTRDLSLKARLDLKNPIKLTVNGIFTDASQSSTIWEILMGEKIDGHQALQRLQDEIGLGEIADVWEQLNSDDAQEAIKSNGYDGIITEFERNSIGYIAFRPEQFQLLTREAIIESYNKKENDFLIHALDSFRPKTQKPKLKL